MGGASRSLSGLHLRRCAIGRTVTGTWAPACQEGGDAGQGTHPANPSSDQPRAVGRGRGGPQSRAARVGPLLHLRNAAHGVSGGRSLRLGTSPALSAAAAQGPFARDEALLRGRGLRRTGRVSAQALSSCATCACSPVREPDAGKPHVRFDEEGRETRDGPFGEWTPTRKGGNSGAPPDLYTTALALHSTERATNFGWALAVGARPRAIRGSRRRVRERRAGRAAAECIEATAATPAVGDGGLALAPSGASLPRQASPAGAAGPTRAHCQRPSAARESIHE